MTELQLDKLETKLLKRDFLLRQLNKEFEQLSSVNFIKELRKPFVVSQPQSLYKTKKTFNVLNTNKIENTKSTDEFLLTKYFFQSYLLKFPLIQGETTNNEGDKEGLKKLLDDFEHLINLFQESPISNNKKLKKQTTLKSDTIKPTTTTRVQKVLLSFYCNYIKVVETEDDKQSSPKEIEPKKISRKGSKSSKIEDINKLFSDEKETISLSFVSLKQTKINLIKKEDTTILYVKNLNTKAAYYITKNIKEISLFFINAKKKFPVLELPKAPQKSSTKQNNKHSLYLETYRQELTLAMKRMLKYKEIVESRLFIEFIGTSSNKEYTLKDEDKEDIEKRKEYQHRRRIEKQKYEKYLKELTLEYKETLNIMKRDIMKKDGIINLHKMIKETHNVKDLPQHFQSVIEWGVINLSGFVCETYCLDVNSNSNRKQLSNLHSMFPFRTLSVIFKYSNPTYIIKQLLNLFLAQPFGTYSLFQRLVNAFITEKINILEKNVETIINNNKDDELLEQLNQFFDNENNSLLFEFIEDDTSPIDKLKFIVGKIDPDLSNKTTARFNSCCKVVESMTSETENTEHVLKIDELGEVYCKEYDYLMKLNAMVLLNVKLNEMKQIGDVLKDNSSIDVIKDLITTFYAPLIQVYKDADLSDFIWKIKEFIDDLVKVNDETNRINSTNLEIKERFRCYKLCIENHVQPFYGFLHKVYSVNSKNNESSIFYRLISWLNKLVEDIKTGTKKEIDLQKVISLQSQNETTKHLIENDLFVLKEWYKRRKIRKYKNMKAKIIKSAHDEENEIIDSDSENDDYDDFFNEKELDKKISQYFDEKLKTENSEHDPFELIFTKNIVSTDSTPLPKDGTFVKLTNYQIKNHQTLKQMFHFVDKKNKNQPKDLSKEPYPNNNLKIIPSLYREFINNLII